MANLRDGGDAIAFVATEDKSPRMEIALGQLVTSFDESAVEDTDLTACLNAYRDRKTCKLDMRPRQWCSAPSTTTTVIGVAFASLQNSSECERVVIAVQDGVNFGFKTASVASSIGSSTAAFGTTFGTAAGVGSFRAAWQHYDKVYFAGLSTGVAYALSTLCGTPTAAQVFKTRPFAGASLTMSVTQDAASDYLETFSSWGTDTVGSNRAATGTLLSGSRVCRWSQATSIGAVSGTVDVDYDNEDGLTIENNQLIWVCGAEVDDKRHTVDATYIWQAVQDWRGVSVITVKYSINPNASASALNFRTSDGSGVFITDADFQCFIKKSGGSFVELSQMDVYYADTETVYVTYDARSMVEADRQTVSEIRFLHKIIKDGGSGWQGDHLINLYKGGETYNLQVESTDRLDKSTTPNRPVAYFLRYRSADGQILSRAIQRTVDPANHKGLAIAGTLPKSGGTISGSATVAGLPWTSADFIDVYRAVDVQATGETRYYKVVDGASNSGTHTWTDYYADKDLIESAVPYLTSFSENGSLLGGTDPAVGITAGCSWKGANVLGDSGGFIYTSRVNTHNDFAWKNADYPFDSQALDDPRTEQVTHDGLAIQGLVGADALYIFSRYSVYVMAGNTPNTANAPQRVTDAGGLISNRGACRFNGGVIYASDNGLYYIEVPFYAQGGAQSLEFEEITKGIRDTWTWLKGSDVSELTVTQHDQVITVVNGARMLRLSKEGTWSPLAVDTGGTILAISGFHHPKYGMQIVTTTGRVGVMGWYKTDWATDLAGDNGTPATWTATTKKWVEYARITRMQVLLKSPDTATSLTVAVSTDRATKSFTISGLTYRYNSFVPQSTLPPAGRWVQMQFTGSASAEIQVVRAELIAADPQRTK